MNFVINTMYCISLYPKITRPSRITSYCATFIDNIFTNYILYCTKSGLLVTDISDHLSVFIVYDDVYKINIPKQSTVYRRMRKEESLGVFKRGSMEQNWNSVYAIEDVNRAYGEF